MCQCLVTDRAYPSLDRAPTIPVSARTARQGDTAQWCEAARQPTTCEITNIRSQYNISIIYNIPVIELKENGPSLPIFPVFYLEILFSEICNNAKNIPAFLKLEAN